MADLREISTDALIELGVLAAGEVMDADQSSLAVRAANRMLDVWAAKRLMIYSPNVLTTWTIVSGTQSYTVGTGGTINMARPDFINDVKFRDTSSTPNVDYPMRKYEDADWQRVTLKTMTAVWPQAWYYNPTYPLGALTLWPVPTSGTLTGLLWAPQAITQFTDINTSFDLPPGYREAFVTNLAVRLAPAYTKQPKPETQEAAEDSLRAIMAVNMRPAELVTDAALLGAGGRRQISFNIRTGQ